jgi:hypothetical protein
MQVGRDRKELLAVYWKLGLLYSNNLIPISHHPDLAGTISLDQQFQHRQAGHKRYLPSR